MSKITLNNVGSLIDATTAAVTINNNTATIQAAFDNTLSLDGTSPNQMNNDLDMNSNQILNLPSPGTANSPLRLRDLESFTNGSLVIPAGGVSSTQDLQTLITQGSLSAYLNNNISLTAAITLPTGFALNGNGYSVTKKFNGDMITVGDNVSIRDATFIGNSATHTGRGIYVATGNNQRLTNVQTNDTASYGLEIAPNVGDAFSWIGGLAFVQSGYAIKLPASETGVSGFRKFIGISAGGGNLIDFSGSHYTIIEDCDGININFGSASQYVQMMNCRFASAPTILGSFHQIRGAIFDGNITLGSGCTSCLIEQQPGLLVVDGSGSTGSSYNQVFPAPDSPLTIHSPNTPLTIDSTNNGALINFLNSGSSVSLLAGNTTDPLIVENKLGQTTHLFADDTLGAGTVANQVTIHAVATGNPINIAATGTDTNISVQLTPKGTGSVILPAVSGAAFGTGVSSFLATPSSANLATALTDETGSGSLVFATSPTLITPLLGTPTSGVLSNCTGLPVTGIAAINNNTIVGNVSGSSHVPAALTSAQASVMLNYPVVLGGFATGVSLNAVADTPITITNPGSKYRVQAICIYNTGSVASLTTAQIGIFSGTGGTGTALLASGTALTGITANAIDTIGNMTIFNAAVALWDYATIQLRCTQVQSAGAACNVYVWVQPIP